MDWREEILGRRHGYTTPDADESASLISPSDQRVNFPERYLSALTIEIWSVRRHTRSQDSCLYNRFLAAEIVAHVKSPSGSLPQHSRIFGPSPDSPDFGGPHRLCS